MKKIYNQLLLVFAVTGPKRRSLYVIRAFMIMFCVLMVIGTGILTFSSVDKEFTVYTICVNIGILFCACMTDLFLK